jgi:predicted transcriptional regulator
VSGWWPEVVLSSTIDEVKKAMKKDPQSIDMITEAAGLDRKTVEKTLDILQEYGVVEKIKCVKPSGKKNGWIRAEYRLRTKG